MPNHDSAFNPIGEKYAAVIAPFLEAHLGREVDRDMVDYLSHLVTSTECELLGTAEVATVLGVSSQRVYQLSERIPGMVARVRATPIFLKESVEEFAKTRKRGK